MAARFITELVEAAQRQRRDAVKVGRDLANERFEVTEEEREILRYTPLTAAMTAHLSEDRDRICDLLIVIGRGSTIKRKRRR